MLNTRSVLWQRTIIFVFIALVSRNCLCAGMLAAATPVSPLPTRGAPPVNQAPAIDPVSDQILFENAGVQTVALTGIGPGNGPADAGQTVTISAASSNTTLIPASALTVTLSGATGILTYQTKADTAGSAIITLTVTDNGGTANGGVDTTITTFTVTIEPPPTLAAIANQSCYQGGGIQTVSLTGIGTGAGPEAANYFVTTLTASSDNPSLVPAPTITGTGAAGTLQYQPASTASGQAHITVTVADSFASGGVNISVRNTRSLPATIAITGTTTFSRTFTITVNGPPTTPQVVGPSAGALVSPLVPFALLATDPGGNALRYDIQVASSTDGPWTDLFTSTATYASSSATAAEFLVPTAGKLAAQSYFWRASAINIAGMAGVWSTPQSMTITPATLPLATAAGTVLLSIPAMTGFMPQMGKWVNQGSIALATATWNASTQNYTLTNVSPTLSSLLQPISTTTSTGFWVKANSPLSLAFAGFPQTAPAVQHLLPGWNLIGMPYLQPIAWDMSALQVRQGETVKSLTDAVQANWVKGFAWGWQPDAASPSGGSYVLIYDNTVIPEQRVYWCPGKGIG